MLEYAIFAFCLIGSGMCCYSIGVKSGIESTLGYFISVGKDMGDGTVQILIDKD